MVWFSITLAGQIVDFFSHSNFFQVVWIFCRFFWANFLVGGSYGSGYDANDGGCSTFRKCAEPSGVSEQFSTAGAKNLNVQMPIILQSELLSIDTKKDISALWKKISSKDYEKFLESIK